MSTRGTKVERNSVSNQPNEIKYEAHKEGTSQQAVKDAKNQRVTNAALSKKKIK